MSTRTGGINTLAWILIICVGGPVVCVVAQWGTAMLHTLLNQ